MSTIRIENKTGMASGLLVALHPGRGEEGIRLPAATPFPSLAVLRRFGVWTAVVLECDVPSGGAIDVEVRAGARPDEPEPQAIFVPRNRTRIPEYPGQDGWSPLDTGPGGGPNLRTTVREDLLRAEFESLRWCESGDPLAPLVRSAWTWFHLDMNTHATLLRERSEIPGWPWKADVDDQRFRDRATDQLLRWLAERSSIRWSATVAGAAREEVRRQVQAARVDHVDAPERWVPHMAAVVRSVFRAWHPNVEHDLTGSGLIDACIRFAGGELDLQLEVTPGPHAAMMTKLALHVTRGQPDSIAILLFSELAIAAIEAGVNVAWWTNALKAFIAMLGPFQCAYGDEGQAATPETYTERCLGRARPIGRRPAEQWMAGLEHLAFDELERAFGERLRGLLSSRLVSSSLVDVQRARGRVRPA